VNSTNEFPIDGLDPQEKLMENNPLMTTNLTKQC